MDTLELPVGNHAHSGRDRLQGFIMVLVREVFRTTTVFVVRPFEPLTDPTSDACSVCASHLFRRRLYGLTRLYGHLAADYQTPPECREKHSMLTVVSRWTPRSRR